MRDFLKTRWTCALAAALLLGLAGASFAQTDVTTSRISGTVEDGAKAHLPGVTIEITNVETGLQKVTVTDADGFYRVLDLPTGTYKLTATLDGFATATAERVRLLIGSTPTVNFTLQSARVSETITVTAEASTVEVTNTQIGTTIQSEQIKNLPSAGNNFQNLVLLTPETRNDSERGNISISGQRGINTNVTVDGVDYNNAFFGGTTGAAEGRAPLSLSEESIKEFSVVTNGASAEFGRSGGGFVNIITKSGTNSLHGSGFYYNQPQSLISDFAKGRLAPGQSRPPGFTTEPADQKKDEFGASLGGTIVKDKLFYFLSYDNQKQDVTIPISSTVLDPAVFAKYPVLASPNSFTQTRDGNVSFGRLDFQVNDANRITARGNVAKYNGENGTSNSPSQTASHNGLEGMTAKTWVGQYSGQFGANLLNDLNLNYVKEDTPRADKGLNLTEVQIPGISYGEVSFLPIVSTNDRKEVGDTLSYALDKHVLKGGIDYNDTGIDQVFKGNWRGVYVFNSEPDLLAGRWSQFRQFGGLNGLSADEAGRAKFRQKESAFFLQDQWFLAPNLTLTGGVRWENLDNPNAPVLNQNDVNANGSFKLNGKIPDSNNNISPRLSIAWAPDEKTAVRGSVGRYWSRTPAILFAQLLTANGVRATQLIISANQIGCTTSCAPTDPLAPGWGSAFDPSGVAPIDFSHLGTIPKPGVFAIDPNFDNPYTDRFTIGAEREVFSHTSLALDFTYAETKQLERLTDINRAYSGGTASNGLPDYNSTTTPNPFYARITTLLSDARSKYVGATATLNRRFSDSFSYYAAVTWSEDKDNDSNERNFSGIQPEDFNNLDLNYGFSNRDQRWKGVVNGVWDTPWWGLGLSGTFRYFTGSPYTGLAGVDLNHDGNNGTDRPTVDGVHFGRNTFRQPDFYQLDLRLSKGFKVWEGNLQLFAECYNCSNAANRFVTSANQTYGANPSLGVNPTVNPRFGVEDGVTSTPRTIQLGIRYDF